MYAFTNLKNYTKVSNSVYFKQQNTRKIKHITYLHLKGAWIRGIRFGKNTKSRYLNPVLVPNVIEDGSQLSLGVSKNDEQKEWMQEERQVGCFLPFISPLLSWKWCMGTCNTAWCFVPSGTDWLFVKLISDKVGERFIQTRWVLGWNKIVLLYSHFIKRSAIYF